MTPKLTSEKKRLSVGLLSLGCPKTLVDSELVLGLINKNHYKIVRQVDSCDIALINTCCFIEDAKKESIDRILRLIQLKKAGKIGAIIVLGCLTQRYQSELWDELGEVDGFVGTGDYGKINRVLDVVARKRKMMAVKSPPGYLGAGSGERIALTPLYSRYLKISEGCDRLCSFCTIPSFRGPYRSRSLHDVVREANDLVNQGARELILTGQDTTFFGYDHTKRLMLPELLQQLESIKNLRWIRLLYAYPALVNQALIETIASSKKICHYIDIPLQHASDRILKLMKRGTTKERTSELIHQLRSEIPDVVLRSTMIVGFPGETDEEFHELLEWLQVIQFEKLGIFMYSQEEGSEAAQMKNQVPAAVKRKRFQAAMTLQQRISRDINRRLIGKTLEVFVEGQEHKKKNSFTGRSYREAPEIDGAVYVRASPSVKIRPGDFVFAQVTDSKEYDLIARFLGKD